MYRYNTVDQHIVDARVEEYRDQTNRYLKGTLSEDEFRDLRLRNGLYVQRHAPMLRVAIPYGLLSSVQVRKLAHIARTYDRDYAHFTTRQNIQFNWPKLETVPDILAELASVEMHAIQTSGNCIRNTTTDHLSGVAKDEVTDPRPYCEIVRQWSTFHPEFNWLPRKFKIAFSGRDTDAAATAVHDIGVRMVKDADGKVGYRILVGGGLGRTPVIGKVIRDYLPETELLSYIDAVLRVYNLQGNRKNKYKARIKITVQTMGVDVFTAAVEKEYAKNKGGPLTLSQERLNEGKAWFAPHDSKEVLHSDVPKGDDSFARWLKANRVEHKVAGYSVVSVSLKDKGRPPGDIKGDELDVLAQLADDYSFGELQVVHTQNVVLAHVENAKLNALYEALKTAGLANANVGTLTDLICCPGGDFCSLANARSIPIAEEIAQRFDDLDYLHDLGEIQLKMSGCINACAHHHVGHIGILGIDKKGEEWYQLQLGGSASDDATLGKVLGPAIPRDRVVDVIEKVVNVFVEHREPEERFLDFVRREGTEKFHSAIYIQNEKGRLCVRS